MDLCAEQHYVSLQKNKTMYSYPSYNKAAVQYILSTPRWCEAYHPEVPIRSAPGLLVGTRQLQAHALTACDTVQ